MSANSEKYTQEAILGLMLLFPELSLDLQGKLKKEWFQGYYKEALEIIMKGGDALSISTNVDSLSAGQVAAWMELEFSSTAADQHIQTLEKQYQRRELQRLGRQILGASEPQEGFAHIETFLDQFASQEKNEPIHMLPIAQELVTDLEKRSKNEGLQGISWGLKDLDEKTQGIHAKQLIVVAGQPSMGKSALAAGVAESAAEAGHGTLIFSCEMPRLQLAERTLSAQSQIRLETIRSARFDDRHWSRITSGLQKMSEFRLWIDDTAGISTQEIHRKIKHLKRKENIELVVVDYLQILEYDDAREVQELGRITRQLKMIAMEQDISIVAISQLNRASQNEKRKPRMADLRASGMIEANADVILFPHRESENCDLCRDNKTTPEHNPDLHKRKAEILLEKQRQGERNISIPCCWLPEVARFKDLAREEE
jgi:replicative DNA helicase